MNQKVWTKKSFPTCCKFGTVGYICPCQVTKAAKGRAIQQAA